MRRDAALAVLLVQATPPRNRQDAEALLAQLCTALLDDTPYSTTVRGEPMHGAHDLCQEALGAHELLELKAVEDVLWYLRDPTSIVPRR